MHGCAAAATCSSAAHRKTDVSEVTPNRSHSRKLTLSNDVGGPSQLPNSPNSKELLIWFESEVVSRIVGMDKKIDMLIWRETDHHDKNKPDSPIFFMPPAKQYQKALPNLSNVSNGFKGQLKESSDSGSLDLPKGDDGLFEEAAVIGQHGRDSSGVQKSTPQTMTSHTKIPSRQISPLSPGSHSGGTSEVPEWVSELHQKIKPTTERGVSMETLSGGGSMDSPTSPTSGRSKRLSISSTNLAGDGETMTYVISSRQRELNQTQQVIWNFLEDPQSSCAASWYAFFISFCVWGSMVTSLLQVIEHPVISEFLGLILECSLDTLFLLELAVRAAVCPSIASFAAKSHNIIDACALPSIALRIYVASSGIDQDSVERILLFGMVPALRLLKALRHWLKFHLLLESFKQAFEALPILMYMLLVILVVFASLIKIAEPPDNIDTLGRAMYFVLMTITTVGYGDYYPVTEEGYVLVCILSVCGILYMAMPLGIIGAAFTVVWGDRQNILLLNRFRECAEKWGFQPVDMPHLFDMFDKDQSGELVLQEFIDLAYSMRLGLKAEEIEDMFNVFDKDGGGTIDIREFVRTLYPKQYHRVFMPDGSPEQVAT